MSAMGTPTGLLLWGTHSAGAGKVFIQSINHILFCFLLLKHFVAWNQGVWRTISFHMRLAVPYGLWAGGGGGCFSECQLDLGQQGGGPSLQHCLYTRTLS